MTEFHPTPLLEFLRRRTPNRKVRLLGCAFVRRAWHLLTHKRARYAVEATERFADGNVQHQTLHHAWSNSGWQVVQRASSESQRVLSAIHELANPNPFHDLWAMIPTVAANIRAVVPGMEGVAQVSLIHDIFGNPFRPVALNPSWQTETVLALATGIYADRAFDRMPVLSDALEDAGCDQPDILNHCRGEGLHVRGCWVVDLLLGKS